MKIKSKVNKKYSKKALSEIVSYVLLIVVALGLAAGVYSWLKFYIPSVNERETCPEDAAIIINDYSCNSSSEIINVYLENKGFFKLNGFIITGSNDTNVLPYFLLTSTDSLMLPLGEGRYDFGIANISFNPSSKTNSSFNYKGLNSPLKRIRIQPYVVGEKKNFISLCQRTTTINVEGC